MSLSSIFWRLLLVRNGSGLVCHGVPASRGPTSGIRSSICLKQFSADTGGKNNASDRPDTNVRGSIPRGGAGVALGQFAEVNRSFTPCDVELYGRLVLDRNPLHQSWDLQSNDVPIDIRSVIEQHPLVTCASFHPSTTRIIVHGMLVGSIFSSIFGTLIPGSVYVSQSMEFRRPVYTNEMILGRITIHGIRHARKGGLILTCKTLVHKEGKECLRGDAEVWLPQGVAASSS